ncbi:short chain dehydrogenase/reductase-like protein [Tricladium varicosporioides]|nr:short chain dehydrogenase/reductase-like protein [Hymenoscyphus varicosporioides]
MVTDDRKVVLITGCAPGGIGSALAKEFNAKGCRVIATARNRSQITDLEELGLDTLALDVTDATAIAAAKEEVVRLTGGRLNILVNNAGRNCTIPALDTPLSEARQTFETNFFSAHALTQAFTPLLISTSSPSSHTLIINIGSVATYIPYVFGSMYNASKAALHAYSNCLRLELEPFGVRVLVVVTGGVESRIARTDRELPPASIYTEVDVEYQRRVKHSQQNAMTAEEYARGVVEKALGSGGVGRGGVWYWLKARAGLGEGKKYYWRGNMTKLIWFVKTWLGDWAFDMVLPGMFGLRRLKKAILEQRMKAE